MGDEKQTNSLRLLRGKFVHEIESVVADALEVRRGRMFFRVDIEIVQLEKPPEDSQIRILVLLMNRDNETLKRVRNAVAECWVTLTLHNSELKNASFYGFKALSQTHFGGWSDLFIMKPVISLD